MADVMVDDASSSLLSTAASWSVRCLGHVGVSFTLLYTAYQLHYLPRGLARIVGRIAFYPTWPLTYLSRRKDYWTLVDSHVMLGAAPMAFMGHVEAMHARGVRAVVNLCDEYAGPVVKYKKLHMAQLRLPTVVSSIGVAVARRSGPQGCQRYCCCVIGPHGALGGGHGGRGGVHPGEAAERRARVCALQERQRPWRSHRVLLAAGGAQDDAEGGTGVPNQQAQGAQVALQTA